jgi:heat shock protein HslJ
MRIGILLAALGLLQPMSSAVWAADSLTGAKWLVERVKGAGTIDTSQTDFTVHEDGAVAASLGCNRMGGTVKIDGDRLSFSPFFATKKACAPALMDAEIKFGAAIEAAKAFKLVDGRLLLLDEKGNELVMLTRAQ